MLRKIKINSPNDWIKDLSGNDILSRYEELSSKVYYTRDDKIFKTIFNYEIRFKNIKTLIGNTWLDTALMDYYFDLLKRKFSKVFCFNSFFYNKILEETIETLILKEKINVNDYDIFILPIFSHSHYTVVIIDAINSKINYYDSYLYVNDYLPRTGSIKLFSLLKYILFKKNMKYNGINLEISYQRNIPRQTNGYDCGVFVK